MNATFTISKYSFNVKEVGILLLTFFMMEGIFSWIFIRNSIIIEGYMKIMSMMIFAFMVLSFRSLTRMEKMFMAGFLAIMLRLIFESLWKFETIFRQLTMFTVLFPVVYTFFIKYVLRKFDLDVLGFIAKFYFFTYLAFMLLFGWKFSFGLDAVEMDDYGPFSGDTRIIHASHILMMIVPLLWYMDRYITKRQTQALWGFGLCAVIIIIHQHRSVWSSALMAVLFYLIATVRNRPEQLSGLQNLFFSGAVITLVAYFFISNLFPGFTSFLADRFSDIFDPAREGSTGNFRLEQRDVYFRLFLERPIFGWTFEGFEMPNPLVDWWPENTGQHFHEGYMEMLFYLGLAGLLLKYSILIYILFAVWRRGLSSQSAILIGLCVSGLLFSFNYVLPLIFWGHAGMCLYYLERDKHESHLHLALR